ncbi:hypothetical protein HK101_008438 [Irineochytrium annulatum]|nr:hypothetical protein HK101_008438 [Irineochytrium annulatum]
MSTRTERFADKNQNDRHARVLKELMQRSDNRRCADCRKKGVSEMGFLEPRDICLHSVQRDPQVNGDAYLESADLAILVRTIVKSADLDTWTPEQIENMAKWGNGKANWYWEHELPKHMEPPESNIDMWIRAKYDRRQYALKGPIPNPEEIPMPDGVVVTTITSGIPAASPKPAPSAPSAKPAPATVASPPAKAATPVSASQDLFDVFQSAPPASSSNPVSATAASNASKNADILSLFNKPSTANPQFSPARINGQFGQTSMMPQNGSSNGLNSISNTSTQKLAGSEFFNQPAFASFPAPQSSTSSQSTNSSAFSGFPAPQPVPTQTPSLFPAFQQQTSSQPQAQAQQASPFPAFGQQMSLTPTGATFAAGSPVTKPGTVGGIPDFAAFGASLTANKTTMPVGGKSGSSSNSDLFGDFQ